MVQLSPYRPRPYRLAVTLLLVAASYAVRNAVTTWIYPPVPGFFLNTAIVLAAAYGGVGSGLVATILTTGLTAQLLARQEQVSLPTALLLTTIFALQGLLVTVVMGRVERARQEAETQNCLILEKEQELSSYAEELARLSGTKDEFMAMLAHELRNHLNPIYLTLGLLAQRPGERQLLERLQSTTERQLFHVLRLIDDLTDSARISRGEVTLAKVICDVRTLLEEIAADHRDRIEQAGIQFVARLEEGSYQLEVDGTRLTQVVGNLLENALKFTPSGGRITLWSRCVPEGIAIGVRDTGVGIRKEELARMWEPFAQGSQPVRHGRRGLGLGLSIVRRLVELHGGWINAFSQGEGTGTEVIVGLPPPACPGPGPARRPQSAPWSPGQLGPAGQREE
jgi:signal transduction histidine kinase